MKGLTDVIRFDPQEHIGWFVASLLEEAHSRHGVVLHLTRYLIAVDNGHVLCGVVTKVGVVRACLVGTHGREIPGCKGEGVSHLAERVGRKRVANVILLRLWGEGLQYTSTHWGSQYTPTHWVGGATILSHTHWGEGSQYRTA